MVVVAGSLRPNKGSFAYPLTSWQGLSLYHERMTSPRDTLHARAVLEVQTALLEVADRAAELSRDADTPMGTVERIRSVRRLRLLDLTVLDRTVLAELLGGAPWSDVAVGLGLPEGETRRRYEETLDAWRAELALPRHDS